MLDRFYLHNFVGAKVNEIGEVLSKANITQDFKSYYFHIIKNLIKKG